MTTDDCCALVSEGCIEAPVLIPCRGDTLAGILSAPAAIDGPMHPVLAVLIVVGGPQYRAGSHRLFVQVARSLAARGVASMRFDVRGMGDSTGEQRSFEELSDDIASAIDCLQARSPQVQSVVLWGLCDAASAALLYCHERQDPRVAGLWLLNPWVRSAESLARTHVKHYYLQRLRQPEFWRKLLAGKVSGTAMADLWTSLRKLVSGQRAAVDKVADESRLPFPARMALGLLRVQRPVQIVLSGQDYTAREFEDHAARDSAWREALAQRQVQVLALQNADHTCSGPDDARWVLQHSCSFCDALA